jgi:hypothetical protein
MLACEHGSFDCKEVIEWPLNTATNANDFITRPCPGGREIMLKRVPGEALLVDEYYWVGGIADE